MMLAAAAAAEADEAATMREGAAHEEMSPFVYPAPGMAADFGVPPTVLRATAAEPTAPPPHCLLVVSSEWKQGGSPNSH
jgi:hypothetical protein